MIYCVDKVTGQHCPVNSTDKPTRISTPSLEGDMIFLVRDDENDSDDHQAQTYFEGKRRRFDLQFQFRLQQETKSIWYGIELDDPIKMGTAKKMLAKAGLSFCQKMNPGSFHSQISTTAKEGPSCMAFKVENSMDRIAQTKPSQPLPRLGEAIEESAASIKQRAKTGLEWNQQDTYTISCFSSYFDFASWTCSVPGLPSFDASSLVGKQPFRFAVYTLEDESAGHTAANKNYIFNLEISHPTKTGMRPAATALLQKTGYPAKGISGSDSYSSLSSQDTVSTTESYDEDYSLSSWGGDCSEKSNHHHCTEAKVLMKGIFF